MTHQDIPHDILVMVEDVGQRAAALLYNADLQFPNF